MELTQSVGRIFNPSGRMEHPSSPAKLACGGMLSIPEAPAPGGRCLGGSCWTRKTPSHCYFILYGSGPAERGQGPTRPTHAGGVNHRPPPAGDAATAPPEPD